MNKILLTLYFTSISLVPSLHAQISETFNEPIISSSWFGTIEKFVVESGQLKLSAPSENSYAYLVTESSVAQEASWEIHIKLDFNPSSSNYAKVYLISDSPDFTGSLYGFYLLIGGTGDEVSLFKQDGKNQTKIIEGQQGMLDKSFNDIYIKVLRNDQDSWELYVSADPSNYSLDGTFYDPSYLPSSYFGFICTYTSTRSDKFFVDDIHVDGKPYIDNSPIITSGDIIITEIMADPSPSQGLPLSEYIELYNRSNQTFNLNKLNISDGTTNKDLPSFLLIPGEYVALTDLSSLSEFNNTNIIGVASLPSLNNDKDVVVLRSSTGIRIDSVAYNTSWYKSSEKGEGGWSMERIDLNLICSSDNNWSASEDNLGGTPGKINSIYAEKPDNTGPELVQAIALDPYSVELGFNETLEGDTPEFLDALIEPEIAINKISFSDASLEKINVGLTAPLQAKTLYTIKISHVRDCNHNTMEEAKSKQTFALIEKADSLDVIFNEILFNPLPNGSDFIELYNKSEKYINLKNWKIGNFENDLMTNAREVANNNLMLVPYGYLVLTENKTNFLDFYPNTDEGLIHETTLPSMPDDEGSLSLSSSDNKIIDALIYTKAMHSPLLKDDEGVSLERIYEQGLVSNWTSASTTSGYATPGKINSNALQELQSNVTLKVDPEIFEPINGSPNFATIHYQLTQPGYVCNATIYDVHGRPIKTLAKNDLLGTEGIYRWDGDNDDGGKARVGYYFAYFEIFDLSGDLKTYRKRIVVAGQF